MGSNYIKTKNYANACEVYIQLVLKYNWLLPVIFFPSPMAKIYFLTLDVILKWMKVLKYKIKFYIDLINLWI